MEHMPEGTLEKFGNAMGTCSGTLEKLQGHIGETRSWMGHMQGHIRETWSWMRHMPGDTVEQFGHEWGTVLILPDWLALDMIRYQYTLRNHWQIMYV